MSRPSANRGELVLILGEVHTGLLQHRASIDRGLAERILALRLGDDVRSFERPISYVVSPDLYDGLDCRLAAGSGPRTRAVGTAASSASITGGRIIQATTSAVLRPGVNDRRMTWSYYLSRPGELESFGALSPERFTAAWLPADGAAPNLGAISGRLLDIVQRSPQLDRPAPLRTGRTRLRWVLDPAEGPQRIEFSLEADGLRTLSLSGITVEPRAVAEFCAGVALHDWLVTVLLTTIDRSGLDDAEGLAAIDRLRPFMDHLLHQWMPTARIAPPLRDFWAGLEQVSGLSRQWENQVRRIRDQLALQTIAHRGAERSREGV